MDAEDLAIDFITEMAIDWEGFIDEHDKIDLMWFRNQAQTLSSK